MAASVAYHDARHLDPPSLAAGPVIERAVGTSGASSRDGDGDDNSNSAAFDPAAATTSKPASPERPTGLACVTPD